MSEIAFQVSESLIEETAHAVARRTLELIRSELDARTPWMNTEEAAEYLRVPLGTFQERAARGEFDGFVKREGRRAYYHRADLDRHRGYGPAGRSREV